VAVSLGVVIAVLVASMYSIVEMSKEVRASNGRLVDADNVVAQVADAIQTGVPLFWLPAMDPDQVT